MIQPNFNLFEKLENTPGKLDKIALLKTANEADKILLNLAVNPDILFHMQKVDYPKEPLRGVFRSGINAFVGLSEHLSSKKALTNEDRYEAGNWLEQCTALEEKWYSRVLLKDLRCGFDVSTVNKAFPGFITVYECALADTYDPEKDEDKLKDSIIDVKLDGIRCLAKVKDGKVILRSRNGKVLTAFPQIEAELAKLPSNVYDGEIYVPGKNGFQTLMKYVKRDEPAPEDLDYRFYIFDVVGTDPYILRRENMLITLFKAFGSQKFEGCLFKFGKRLGALDAWGCFGIECGNKQVIDLLEIALAAGFEGVMVKDENAPYKAKRSKNILKVKRFYSAEFEVTGSYEGKKKNIGKLGGINLIAREDTEIVYVEDGKIKKMIIPAGSTFNAGGAFSDELRNEYWQDRESLIGRIAEIKFQELTKENIPRFPIFLRFRTDMEIGL